MNSAMVAIVRIAFGRVYYIVQRGDSHLNYCFGARGGEALKKNGVRSLRSSLGQRAYLLIG